MANKPWHTGPRYKTASRLLIDTATANPHAICARCGHTPSQHRPQRNGTPGRWNAGHTRPGSTTWQLWPDVTQQPPPGDWLAAEWSTCNLTDGATIGNRNRHGNALNL